MYSYNIMEWLLFFYIYCFFGWVWECLYVSVCKAKWVNRGFMHGPFLPIYGTGAVIMLFLTIPVKNSIVVTFLVGMTGATILEFVTGVLMEKMFGVRYWDYSNCFMNFHGHICLQASLLWGFFSVLLVNVIHALVEKGIGHLSFCSIQVLGIIVTAIFSADFSAAFREALDLKELLINLTESHEELRVIEKRVEAVASAIGNEVKEKSTETLAQLNKALENNKQRVVEYKEKMHHLYETTGNIRYYTRSMRLLRRNPDAVSGRYRQALKELIRQADKNKRNQ